MYCDRIAPGETDRTCREVGARAVFENKIQNDDAWKLYKRAYKKYYARVMKGSMSREDFNVWAERAAAKRKARSCCWRPPRGRRNEPPSLRSCGLN